MERSARQRMGDEAAAKHRIAIKEELRKLLGTNTVDSHRELIVVDAARHDQYPAPDTRLRLRTVSPWFKTEGWANYAGGLEVGTPQYHRIKIRRRKAEIVRRGGEYMLLAMRIPFRNIIACEAYDDAYGLPLLYCHFDCRRHLPYESVEVYKETPEGFKHLDDVQFKNRLTLREVVEAPARLKAELAQRRFDREVETQRRQLESG